MNILRILLFNPLTNSYLSYKMGFWFLSKRLKAMSLDYLYMIAVFFPLLFVFLIPTLLSYSGHTLDRNALRLATLPAYGLIALFTAAVLNKDFFDGRSVGKRIFGYQVVDATTGAVATDLQCVIRNTGILLWPIEIMVALVSPRRRVGDLLAGTMLKEIAPVDPKSILMDAKEKIILPQSVWALVLSVGIAILTPLSIILIEYVGF